MLSAEPGLVLASTSGYRRSLLERLGIPFRCRAPLCDESALQRESADLDPRGLAETLALAKASSLARAEPGLTMMWRQPSASSIGRTPARTREDLPEPEGPTTAVKRELRSLRQLNRTASGRPAVRLFAFGLGSRRAARTFN